MNIDEYENLPSTVELKRELKRIQHQRMYRRVIVSTVFTLVTVSAIAILVATLWLPVLQIYGSSMEPTLHEGNIVVSVKGTDWKRGDIIAFYYNNKVLVKRVIAFPSDWVDISEDGIVSVNGEILSEPYVDEYAFGSCDIELPYQVPEGRIFVLGDHRSVSVDSRNTALGCVSEEQVVGKLTFVVWPLNKFGHLE